MFSIAVVTALAPSLLGVGGFSAFTYLMYQQLPTPYYKNKLKKLFIAGGIYRKVTKPSGPEGKTKEILILPDIKRVGVHADHAQIIFALPNGVNPNDVMSKLWLFKQGFGNKVELKGDCKTFNLEVYQMDLAKFDYNLEEIKESVKGYKLPIIAGKTRKGYIVYDMTEHPHLLVAGETGSGKSVQLRSILTTLITCIGDKVELYLGDLKRSEFHLFKNIAETVDYDDVRLQATVTKIHQEMKKRGKLLEKYQVAHVMDLPDKVRPKYIILGIDEVAMLKKKKELMSDIEDISAIGRALGVFLILSMQRPDADVLDGKLKNNLTVRMGFRHRDAINSRITLDSDDAAHINKNDKGRNILAIDQMYQVQAPYLDLEKAKEILAPYKRLNEPINIDEEGVIEIEDYEVLEDELEGIIEFGVYEDDNER